MKKLLLAFCTAMLFLGMVGNAMALPMTWTDTIDFNPDLMVPPSRTYTHDISDNGYSGILMGGNDTINSFNLNIALYDDNLGYTTQEFGIIGWCWIFPIFGWETVYYPDGTESAQVTLLGQSQTVTIGSGSNAVAGTFWSELVLEATGHLTVTVSSNYGDFYLASSTLTATGDDGTSNGTAPVPEPTTMLLMGSGLLGLAGFRRKARK